MIYAVNSVLNHLLLFNTGKGAAYENLKEITIDESN